MQRKTSLFQAMCIMVISLKARGEEEEKNLACVCCVTLFAFMCRVLGLCEPRNIFKKPLRDSKLRIIFQTGF